MPQNDTIGQILTQANVQINLINFLINLLFTALLATFLSKVYLRCAQTLSSKTNFSRNFLLVACATMLIISIVKSSLALSLGLVGALSIVRFRTAIKEPEELVYTLLAISIGLGFGADQGIITAVAIITICVFIYLRSLKGNKESVSDMLINIQSQQSDKMNLESVNNSLASTCTTIHLKRFDEQENQFEAVYNIEITNIEKLNELRQQIIALDPQAHISFIDNRGII